MATPQLVQCERCGKPYSARAVGDEVVLPTNDGKCTCGSEAVGHVEEASDSPDGAAG